MESILVLIGLFLTVLTSGRTEIGPSTDISEWGEKEDVWRWNVEDYPHPQRNPKYCHRFSPSNICDPDDILTKEQAVDLDSAIRRLYNDTPCLCPECSAPSGGIIIGIAAMKNIYLPYNEHPSIVIREFAEELRRRWSLGECKNEIIIVLVTQDRMSFTSVGPSISSYISPEESRIFHENRGYFTIGDYYKGLLSMVQAYYDLTRSIKLENDVDQINTGLVAGVVCGVIMLVVLIVLVVCTLRRRKSRPPSFRKDSWDGDPSHSWKRKQYRPCNTQEVGGKLPTVKQVHSENNNDQVISARRQERVAEKRDDTTAPNETLLTTVAELENEDNTSTIDASDRDHDIPITKANGKKETELQYTEPGISSFTPQTVYKGTITNL